ncbi:hypothetical protein PT974_05959 [Cladobotryum mycophilum]|uniref:Uncharacterized protein n=1 Tax=Cladobotryum mycophilum TaxID=491253 RepID=A0ABR0SK71_9HYPO
MAFAAKSRQDVTDLLRRRNLTNIPRDQQALLESENSWAIELKDTPHDSGHVPGHVLQTVKEAYIRRKTKTELRPRSSPQSHSAPGSTTSDGEQDENYQELPHSPTSKPSSVASSPERDMSWSPSPSRSQDPKDPDAKSRNTQGSNTQSLLNGASSPTNSSAKGCAQLRFSVKLWGRGRHRNGAPQAQHKPDIPINRTTARILSPVEESSTATTNTPPCAQPEGPIIPNTVQKPGDPRKGEMQRRSRRMKPIVFNDDSPETTKTVNAPTAVVRMPSIKTFPEPEGWTLTNSSSIVPATYHDDSPENTNPLPPANSVTHDDEMQQVTGSVVHHNHEQPVASNTTHEESVRQITNNTMSQDNSQPLIASVESPAHQSSALNRGQNRLPGRSSPNSDRQLVHIQHLEPGPQATNNERMDPYKAFITIYPDYVTIHNGNLWHFVQACMCIQILLDEEAALKECLYDDFIRAFSSGFLKYVRDAGPGQDPLPADAWYLRIRGHMLFNRLCVRVDNLEHILSSYPEEVARARAVIRIHREKEEETRKIRSETPMKAATTGAAKPDRRERYDQDQDEDEDQPQPRQQQVLQRKRTSQTSADDPPLMKPSARPLPQIRAASPDLGSDPIQPEPIRRQPMQPPKSSAPKSSAPGPTHTPRAPRPSQYFDRLLSSARVEQTTKKRSSEEQERLREYIRKRRARESKLLPSSSRA